MTSKTELVYYPDNRPGIRRQRHGRGFCYFASDDTRIERGKELARLKSMAVPPAYENVWMTPVANGHLQATGYDSRERKQYRYHPDWVKARNETKYASLASFGRALPQIRRTISKDLRAEAGEKKFALAAAALMIDRLALRVGNEDYAEENGSYGAVTLRRRHVRIYPDAIYLNFKAKGGQRVRRKITDTKLHKILAKARDLPGAELLTWVDDDGEVHSIGSAALNEYLREAATCETVSAKSFRTWVGTLIAFRLALADKANTIASMAAAAAEALGNTPTVARSAYIHPAVIDLAGKDFDVPTPTGLTELLVDERRLLAFLERSDL